MQSLVLNHEGEPSEFDLHDRGLAYGDGVFETILIYQGQAVWWDAHWQRLLRGAQRLRLPVPNHDKIYRACEAFYAKQQRAVLKIMYTRGTAGRGYKIPTQASPSILLSLHAAPEKITHSIRATWCETQLSIQPALAGIKHLNRLENVLARSEWSSPDIDEGLMCDSDGRVVCATAANIFIRRDKQWLTPVIDRCGIQGVAREWVLQHLNGAKEAVISREDVMQAEAVFLCNAVRGIMPVGALNACTWALHPDILCLQEILAYEQPAFALGEFRGT
jgi:4-amino-4-deoxychorismate lyase